MAHHEDTEWNDILREKGIIPEINEEDLIDIVDKVIEEHHNKPMEKMSLEELDEFEDEDLEDDRVFEHFKRQRMQELQQQLSREIYGRVVQISKPDYQKEVTDASKNVWVIVNLFQSHLPDSKLMSAILERLASKYRAVKFLKIAADMCIPNYPDRNVPTLLIYGEGDLKQQIVGLSRFGGKACSVENVEIVLRSIGALPKNVQAEDEQDREEEKISSIFGLKKDSAVTVNEDDWD
jgi:thiol-disulfide isomerase/thioredoxin